MRWFCCLLVLTGCVLPEDRFAEEAARAGCTRYEQCDPLLLHPYGGMDGCIDAHAGFFEGVVYDAARDRCEYDPKAASDCLIQLRNAACEGFFPAAECDFDAIWRGCDPEPWVECRRSGCL